MGASTKQNDFFFPSMLLSFMIDHFGVRISRVAVTKTRSSREREVQYGVFKWR